MQIALAPIDCREFLSASEFVAEYAQPRRPVVIQGMMRGWNALLNWTPDSIAAKSPELNIPVKEFCEGEIKRTTWRLKDYAEFLNRCNPETEPAKALPYCHDIPLFHAIPGLSRDVSPFPVQYLPKYYQPRWWMYAQFFLGPKFSVTPLHFDCLLTNNLFFQIYGRKRFILFAPTDQAYCYRQGWRWFQVDPENPDYTKFPLFAKATPLEVVISPGEILYIPPGMLHHVRSLDTSISFNVDWHSRATAFEGVCGLFQGMPLANVHYNFWILLGLSLGMPHDLVFRFYKRYLNYVS